MTIIDRHSRGKLLWNIIKFLMSLHPLGMMYLLFSEIEYKGCQYIIAQALFWFFLPFLSDFFMNPYICVRVGWLVCWLVRLGWHNNSYLELETHIGINLGITRCYQTPLFHWNIKIVLNVHKKKRSYTYTYSHNIYIHM